MTVEIDEKSASTIEFSIFPQHRWALSSVCIKLSKHKSTLSWHVLTQSSWNETPQHGFLGSTVFFNDALTWNQWELAQVSSQSPLALSTMIHSSCYMDSADNTGRLGTTGSGSSKPEWCLMIGCFNGALPWNFAPDFFASGERVSLNHRLASASYICHVLRYISPIVCCTPRDWTVFFFSTLIYEARLPM